MKHLICIFSIFAMTSLSFANCLDKYKETSLALSQEKPDFSSVAKGVGVALMPASFCALGGMMGPPGWIYAGACFTVAGITGAVGGHYLKKDSIKKEKDDIDLIIQLLENKDTNSKRFDQIVQNINTNRVENFLSKNQVIDEIIHLNDSFQLCEDNKLMSLRDIQKTLKNY